MTSVPPSDSPGSVALKQAASEDPLRTQVRGSSLLVMGRICSLAMNVVTQIVIVRAISRSDFGLFAYGISLVELISVAANLALDKTFLRYGAIYHERNERGPLVSLIVFSLALPVALSLAVAAVTFALPSRITAMMEIDPASFPVIQLLSILIACNVIASSTLSMLNVLQGARAVFFRKHLLSPLLKLLAVIVVLLSGGQLYEFVVAVCIAAGLGAVIDLLLLTNLFSKEKLWSYIVPGWGNLPTRELIDYSLPILVADLSFMARGTLLVILLGYLGTSEATAGLRAVLPVARLSEMVFVNFVAMFIPIASRLYATNDNAGLWQTFQQTNLWLMSLSFPVFAACCGLAFPLTVQMFGPEYRDAAIFLCLISFAYYHQSTHGLNGQLLRVLGHVRILLLADVFSAVFILTAATIGFHFWSSLGAVIAAAVGILLNTHLRTAALYWTTGETPSALQLSRSLLMQALALGLAIFVIGFQPGWIGGGFLAIGTTLVMLLAMRTSLDIEGVFPAIRKLPFVSFLAKSRVHDGAD